MREAQIKTGAVRILIKCKQDTKQCSPSIIVMCMPFLI